MNNEYKHNPWLEIGILFLIVFVLLTLLYGFAVRSVEAQEKPVMGVGYYALTHPDWPCKASMKALDNQAILSISYLSNTFGNDRNCLKKILADPRPKQIEVQLFNQVCVRNRRCFPYEHLFGETLDTLRAKLKNKDKQLLKKIRNVAAAECGFFAPYMGPNLTLLVGGFLEHDMGPLHSVVLDAIRPVCPGALLVDGPMVPSKKSPSADYYEAHGEKPYIKGPTLVNLDGTDAFSIDMGAYLDRTQKAKINHLWIYEFNANCRGSKDFIDPRKRTCFPSPEDFKGITKLLRGGSADSTPDDPSCRSWLQPRDGAKKGFLWKQSDTHPQAVTLLPQPGRFKDVYITRKGKRIDSLKYFYQYSEDNSNRQVWRATRSAASFPFDVVLHADDVCYLLDTPQGRID